VGIKRDTAHSVFFHSMYFSISKSYFFTLLKVLVYFFVCINIALVWSVFSKTKYKALQCLQRVFFPTFLGPLAMLFRVRFSFEPLKRVLYFLYFQVAMFQKRATLVEFPPILTTQQVPDRRYPRRTSVPHDVPATLKSFQSCRLSDSYRSELHITWSIVS
jgi:hypothetical protein